MKSGVGTLLAFLAWLLVVPDAAVAQCRSHDRPAISLATGAGIRLQARVLAGGPAVADPAETPRRQESCTGSMCSGRPAVPLSSAPPQVLRVDMWAILDVATKIVCTDRSDALPVDGQCRPIRPTTSIFHPPRREPSGPAS